MDKTHQAQASPFLTIFETFRAELDEHHDRRERVIKASRDITAASKKIIFSLQRIRKLNESVPPSIQKASKPYYDTIKGQYSAVSADLQGLSAYRYRSITGGNQEFMEAVVFQHYVTTQTLLSYEDACAKLKELSGEAGPVMLTIEDYLLGIYDFVGELMRFAITVMATSGKLPGADTREQPGARDHASDTRAGDDQQAQGESMDVDAKDEERASPPRSILSDLRELRTYLEKLDVARNTPFGSNVQKKMGVMQTCVEKVENAVYALTVRGSERPKGWMPDVREDGRRGEVESY